MNYLILLVALAAPLMPPKQPLAQDGDRAATLREAQAILDGDPAEALRRAGELLDRDPDREPDAIQVALARVVARAHHLEQRFPEAVRAYTRALDLSASLPEEPLRDELLAGQAFCLRMVGNYDGALANIDRLLEQAQEDGDDRAVAEISNERGIVLLQKGDSDAAIEAWQLSLELLEVLGDDGSRSLILGNLGVLHGDLGQFEQSVSCIELSMALADEAGRGASLPINLVNLGDALRGLGRTQEARDAFERAIELFQAEEDRVRLAGARSNLALIFDDLGEPHTALVELHASLELYTELGLEAERATCLAHLATVLARLDRPEESIALSTESLELSQDVKSLAVELDALLALAEGHEARGDHAAALAHLRRARALEAELHSTGTREAMRDFAARLETEKRERELLLQAERLERRELERNALIGGALLFLLAAASGWGLVWTRRRAHRDLQQAFGDLQAVNANLVVRDAELRDALSRIKRLEGFLPICASCKSIRDEEGHWHTLETYLGDRSEVSFSHGYCPGCADAMLEEERTPAERRP